MTGNLDMSDNPIIGIMSSSQDNAALTVGGAKSTYLPLSGDRGMEGNLNLGGNVIRNMKPFVEDDSSQAASDAQRNDVINFGYFKDQTGEIERQINEVSSEALNRIKPDPMEDSIDMDGHSTVGLKEPKSSDSNHAVNVNYVNKTISDNNAVINTKIKDKIKESEEYVIAALGPHQNVFKYLMDNPGGEIIDDPGKKGVGRVQKDFHSFNRETYHMQLTLPKTRKEVIFNYSFEIQIHPLASQRYTLVFELYHTNVIREIEVRASSDVATVSQIYTESSSDPTRSLINFEKK